MGRNPGFKVSVKTKAKMSRAKRRPIQIGRRVYPSIQFAAKANKVSRTTIHRLLKRGFKFKGKPIIYFK